MKVWDRLEPSNIDTDVEEGLQARIADPLWLLARQWQFGEFRGEDAASPIDARIVCKSYPLQTFRNETVEGASIESFSSARPLECRVEQESVRDGPAAIRLAADSGAQFLRRLDLAGLGEVRRSLRTNEPWRSSFGFDLEGDGVDTTHLPERMQQRLALIERRGVDGRKLYNSSSESIEEIFSAELAEHWSAVSTVLDEWKSEYASQFAQPGDDGDCWQDDRLEYSFAVGTWVGDEEEGREVVLSANEYFGGHLDWYAFKIDNSKIHGLDATNAAEEMIDRHVFPQPASFNGQPASRWWEFEDQSVYFGSLSAGPADVARLVVASFATVFSDDWFIIPITLSRGSLSYVETLKVTDVFGGTTEVKATALSDGDECPFQYFRLENDKRAEFGHSPFLLLPNTVADSQNGSPVENVTFVRDENANLGWAIEQTIELPTGEPMQRRRQWTSAQAASRESGSAVTTTSGPTEVWRYRLQTPVPPWWIPLVPERSNPREDTDTSFEQIKLRRARMPGWQEIDSAFAGANGQIVGVRGPLRIHEEEVPRGGVQVTRAWQRARGLDGSVHTWMARRKRPGRGDRASGLEFDSINRLAVEAGQDTDAQPVDSPDIQTEQTGGLFMATRHVSMSEVASENVANISSAIEEVAEAGGGTISFDSETYPIDAPIVVDKPGVVADLFLVCPSTTFEYSGASDQPALTFECTGNAYQQTRGLQGTLSVRAASDSGRPALGVCARGLIRGAIGVLHISGFEVGFELSSNDNATGFCRFEIDELEDNDVGVKVLRTGSWINEVAFVGGHWRSNNTNLQVGYAGRIKLIDVSFGGGPANSNIVLEPDADEIVFIGCRLEDFNKTTVGHRIVDSQAKSASFLSCNIVTRFIETDDEKLYDTPQSVFHTGAEAGRHIVIGCQGPEFVSSDDALTEDQQAVSPVFTIGGDGAGVSPSAIGQQMIWNPAFQYFDSGSPFAWRARWGLVSSQEAQDLDGAKARHGDYVTKAWVPADNGGKAVLTQKLSLVPGALYTGYVRYRISDNATSSTNVTLGSGAVGDTNRYHNIPCDVDGGWHEKTFRFRAVEGSTDIGFQVEPGVEVWLDMMAVQAGLEVPHIRQEPDVLLKSDDGSQFRLYVDESSGTPSLTLKPL